MKACTKCGNYTNSFSPNKRTRDGRSSWCRECNARAARLRRSSRTPEENSRRDFASNLGKHHLSVQDFAALLARSDGRCMNTECNRPLDLAKGQWAIDHDHSCCQGVYSCGKCIRGILCLQCNTALGLLDESANKARGLMRYLKTSTQSLHQVAQKE